MNKGNNESNKIIISLLLLIGVAFIAGLSLIGFLAASTLDLNGQKVAVVQIKGYIGGTETSMDKVIRLLEKARDDPKVGAIVLDINSPGGFPVPTREIGEKVKELKKKKPVVAWIGESGASGAYWIATTADTVMADPLSMVGSIGVILQVPNISGLMDKLGVTVTTITGGEYKDLGSPFSNMTSEEREILEDISDQLHQEFVKEVSENRGLSLNETRDLADGRIYLGREALKLGLIDEIGTRDQAIEKAAQKAGIKPNWFYLREEGIAPLLKEVMPQGPFWTP